MKLSVPIRPTPGDVYKARPGSGLRDKDAPIIGEWLEEIGPKDAQQIVDAAAEPGAPPVVHDYFTWDDTQAGIFWRRNQARKLARAITVEIVEVAPDGEAGGAASGPFTVPAFHAVRDFSEDGAEHEGRLAHVYVSYKEVRKEERYKEEVIEDARRELISRRRKYAASLDLFAEEAPDLSDVFDAIARLEGEEEEEQ